MGVTFTHEDYLAHHGIMAKSGALGTSRIQTKRLSKKAEKGIRARERFISMSKLRLRKILPSSLSSRNLYSFEGYSSSESSYAWR